MDANKIGAYLARLRQQKGLTQQEAAERLHLSNKTISKWENGGGLPEVTVLPALSALYGVTTDEILAGEPKAAAHEPPFRRGSAAVRTAHEPVARQGKAEERTTHEPTARQGKTEERAARRFWVPFLLSFGLMLLSGPVTIPYVTAMAKLFFPLALLAAWILPNTGRAKSGGGQPDFTLWALRGTLAELLVWEYYLIARTSWLLLNGYSLLSVMFALYTDEELRRILLWTPLLSLVLALLSVWLFVFLTRRLVSREARLIHPPALGWTLLAGGSAYTVIAFAKDLFCFQTRTDAAEIGYYFTELLTEKEAPFLLAERLTLLLTAAAAVFFLCRYCWQKRRAKKAAASPEGDPPPQDADGAANPD